MTDRVKCAGLQVSPEMYHLVSEDICKDLQINSDTLWRGFAQILADFMPRNAALLAKRDELQQQIDDWHAAHREGYPFSDYKQFLTEIGYLVPEGEAFEISPSGVDPEITTQAGPQLVVPIMNARFALNAVNARWGSLYDALYGNDVIAESGGADKSGSYNPVRGQRVIDYGRDFLDGAVPLVSTSHREVVAYTVVKNDLVMHLASGESARLKSPNQWVGYLGSQNNPSSILLKNNNLHIEIQVDYNHYVGVDDRAGVKDIVLEAALTTIMDCEDSVAAVDGPDKVLAYRNWMGLLRGSLTETISRGERSFERSMLNDREYFDRDGNPLILKGRALMFVRNVGHLMTTPTILDSAGNEIPEGIMDGLMTSLIGLFDLRGQTTRANSTGGSLYIVKPKMHGPEEVAFTNDLFDAIEDLLDLPRHTLKVGIMDEERRTSVNLKACIRAARERVVFINTGFLDRTGDEIHTSMQAGPFALKGDLKQRAWISAYEDQNVDIGLACGFRGRAQIGKGMWPIPDNMADMMVAKIDHPQAGANTAWVPSPSAATLHAMHYHQVDVDQQQATIAQREPAELDDILEVPLLGSQALSADQIQRELDNNAQGILGYVVRWVEQGIGCSKVPDIDNVGLMEDRATLRISSQHISNWLHHGIISRAQVEETLERMAVVVDQQNAGDGEYRPMAPDFSSSLAFRAAADLIFLGVHQPSGYTEPLLHSYRQLAKQQA
jgi:malate synthase